MATRGMVIIILENIILINTISMSRKVCDPCTHLCVGVHTHVCSYRGQRRMWGVSLYYYPPYLLRQGLSLNWMLFELGCLAGEFLGSTYLNPPVLGLQACVVRPRFCGGGQGFELRPSCFNGKHSDTMSHTSSPGGFS